MLILINILQSLKEYLQDLWGLGRSEVLWGREGMRIYINNNEERREEFPEMEGLD